MLALSRKKDESIIIGDHIEITILDIQGEQVKLGIKAPKHISIHRKEVYIQIQEENKAASTASKEAVAKLGRLFNLQPPQK